MSAVLGDPENREEPVPRREFDALINIVVPRLSRIEELCFHDQPSRPSLATMMAKIDTHINVLCSWARGIKFVIVGLGTFSTAFVATLKLVQELRLW